MTRSDRYRVIQRADVDCFFGATLESVFVPAHDCAPAESSRDPHPMATVGSLLKSAHLMMFFLMGYRYALSPGGWFLGHHVLGSFFRKYANAGRRAAIDAAEAHFRPFSGLVRRIHSPRDEIKGTLGSRELFWCTDGDEPWAFVPVIRAGGCYYAVVVPTLSSAECEARFREMLRAPHLPLDAQPMTLYRDEWKRGSGGPVCLPQL